jgi:hypothetical protein
MAWLDLGDADGELVKITSGGWRVVPGDGPLFRRTRLTCPLPKPLPGGDLGRRYSLLLTRRATAAASGTTATATAAVPASRR